MRFILKSAIAMTLFVSSLANAQWTLDTASSDVFFLTTKNTHITETSHFKSLSGALSNDGQATLKIDLASIDSLIPIRNERMAKFLFETSKFAEATVTVKVAASELKSLAEQGSLNTQISAKVSLHGVEKTMPVAVFASQDSKGNITLVTTKPLLIQATDFALKGGIDQLKDIAKLASISYTVPVSFKLTYKK